ncbi:MAG: hypothetical protein M1119_10135 [Firmicutes bacterium]|nr:hypothetical protein [Bacillota bacterium]
MRELIKETLQSCQEYMPVLISAVGDAAFLLQSGDEARGVQLVIKIIDGLQWVIDAVQGVQQNGFSLNIDITDIAVHFQQLESALTIRDYVLVADLFEYEIAPTLQIWLDKVNTALKDVI